MRRLVGVAFLLSATCYSAAGSMAQPDKSGAAVRRALVAHDYRRAELELNKLVIQRLPATDKAGPDQLLDQLFAELTAANGSPASAITLLTRLTSNPRLIDRPHYRLLLATAYEDAGRLDEAERVYRAVGTDREGSRGDRATATIGFARLRMMADPQDAIAALQALDPPREQAWEWHLQQARAEALAENDEASRLSLAKAWAEAPFAGVEQAAVARTATDMLVAAGRTGDRGRLVALLAVDRLNRGLNPGQEALAADVPVCGEAGITPDDAVAIQVVRQAASGHPRLSVVWASRSAIAAPFLNAVTGSTGYKVQDGQAVAVILRCRTAPAADYQVRSDLDDRIASWLTGRGVYPLLETGDEVDAASLASALADRERRYGARSVMLVPVLSRVLAATVASGFESQEARTRAAALSHRINDIISSNGGPPDLVLLTTLSSVALDVAAQAKSVSVAQAEFQTLLEQAAKTDRVSLDTLYMQVITATAYKGAPSALRASILEKTLDVVRARAGARDPRALALAMRLIQLRSEQGDANGVGALVREYGLALDLCATAVPPVRFISSNITPDDYPPDLTQALLQGRTLLEFSIDQSGSARNARVLISDPPYAFDSVALAKSSTLTWEPAKRAGTPFVCRGQTQAIRWQLPY